jgi:hypothetical protein
LILLFSFWKGLWLIRLDRAELCHGRQPMVVTDRREDAGPPL